LVYFETDAQASIGVLPIGGLNLLRTTSPFAVKRGNKDTVVSVSEACEPVAIPRPTAAAAPAAAAQCDS
jgi:hypothetical protein